MKALVRTHDDCQWLERKALSPHPAEVLVAVRMVGLCLTDLAVASGELPVASPRTVGHEFVGNVIAVGETVKGIHPGQRVAVDPVVRCGQCMVCRSTIPYACQNAQFMGVDIDGAIADQVSVTSSNVYPVADHVDDTHAAMLEPVAACAAVVDAPISPKQHGAIVGRGRISELTRTILQLEGFGTLDLLSTEEAVCTGTQYDFVVDATGSTESLHAAAGCTKPGGQLILKSRPIKPFLFDLRRWLPKQLQIHLTHYGDFAKASQWIEQGRLNLQKLVGPVWEPQNFHDAFASARQDIRRKHYIVPPEAAKAGMGRNTLARQRQAQQSVIH